MENKELQVGDRVYSLYSNSITGIHTIMRTTNTQAVSDSGYKFKKPVSDNGFCRRIGGNIWDVESYRLENKGLIELHEKQRHIARLKQAKWNLFDLATLRELMKILNANNQ